MLEKHNELNGDGDGNEIHQVVKTVKVRKKGMKKGNGKAKEKKRNMKRRL